MKSLGQAITWNVRPPGGSLSAPIEIHLETFAVLIAAPLDCLRNTVMAFSTNSDLHEVDEQIHSRLEDKSYVNSSALRMALTSSVVFCTCFSEQVSSQLFPGSFTHLLLPPRNSDLFFAHTSLISFTSRLRTLATLVSPNLHDTLNIIRKDPYDTLFRPSPQERLLTHLTLTPNSVNMRIRWQLCLHFGHPICLRTASALNTLLRGPSFPLEPLPALVLIEDNAMSSTYEPLLQAGEWVAR